MSRTHTSFNLSIGPARNTESRRVPKDSPDYRPLNRYPHLFFKVHGNRVRAGRVSFRKEARASRTFPAIHFRQSVFR